jgi:VWFA-related protein
MNGAFACCALAAFMTAASAFQTFRSGVEVVRVDVLVMDGNTPVSGLTAAEFELRDSGVVQRIDAVRFEDVPLNVVLTLDVSESVEGRPLEHLKEAAHAAVGLLRSEDRASLVAFNDYVMLRSDWTADFPSVSKAIDATIASGATALYDAAFTSLTLRDPRTSRTLVLLFSDGEDTASWLPGINALEAAKRSEAVVYAVEFMRYQWRPGYQLDFHSGLQLGTDGNSTDNFLSALAEQTGGRWLTTDRFDRLEDTFVQIIKEFRTRYLLTYTPKGVEATGWHPVTVKLKGKTGTVTARRGYLK